MGKIYNAKIKFSFLGFDTNGVLCIQLGFECRNGVSYTSDKLMISDSDQDYYFCADIIKDILNVLELNRWEDLPRKFARIEVDDDGIVIAVGNLIEERWVKL